MRKTKGLQWLVINTRPHQERKVRALIEQQQSLRQNILEVYSPSHPTVRVQRGNHEEQQPLFAGKVFVLSTQEDIKTLLSECYPEGYLEYDKTQQCVMAIPERQMLFFMDFNEHYPEKVLVLERPYTDYAFNAKNDAPNEAIMVMDGPFKGKTGYLVKFRGQRRMVFQMQGIAVSLPDIWDYHLTRLHNSTGDRQSRATLKARIADSIVGKLHGCGFTDNTHAMLCRLLTSLSENQSLAHLRKELLQHTESQNYRALDEKLKTLTPQEASDILSLANFIKTNTDFLDTYREAAAVRPFLTPTSGITQQEDKDYAVVSHPSYCEIVRKETFSEPTFYPQEDQGQDTPVTYYAHVGIVQKTNGKYVVFANFNGILKECFLLGGAAKEKQLETFRNYCPMFYSVIKGEREVKIVKDLTLGDTTISALGMQMELTDTPPCGTPVPLDHPEIQRAIATVVQTTRELCQEINSSTHLVLPPFSLVNQQVP